MEIFGYRIESLGIIRFIDSAFFRNFLVVLLSSITPKTLGNDTQAQRRSNWDIGIIDNILDKLLTAPS